MYVYTWNGFSCNEVFCVFFFFKFINLFIYLFIYIYLYWNVLCTFLRSKIINSKIIGIILSEKKNSTF
jgi:hypothetical protein